MDQDLARYINDHLAGSSGALLVIEEITTRHDDPEARIFFADLLEKVRQDRELLESLLEKIGRSPSSLMKMAGAVAARAGGLKLLWEKVEPGELGMLEALEMLAIGIQGKCLLWVALREIQPWFAEWSEIDFQEMEMEAIRQRDVVEEWRVRAARESLVSTDRIHSIAP